MSELKPGPVVIGYCIWTVDVFHRRHDGIEVALVAVELVNEKDYRLLQFLRISEVVLCPYLGPVLPVDEYHGLVGHIECRYRAAHEVVGTGAVDDIQLLVVPFYVEHRRENRVAILLFHGEIVAYGVLCLNGAAALYDAGFVEHCFGKSCLAATRTAKQCNVFNLVCLIYSHIVIDLSWYLRYNRPLR